MNFEIETNELPTATVVSVQREVRIAELPGFISDSLRDLRERAGESAGSPFSVFHGRVDEEEGHHGPVEVCVPVAPGTAEAKELLGGRAVSTRVTGDQCEFPAIIQAYEALYRWLADKGYDPAGPPREVYVSEGTMEILVPYQEHDPGGM